ncbi:MAG: trehalose-phosphatase [Pseudomonadota bacterium]
MDALHSIIAKMPPLSRAAFFLDFDGTLIDLAETPDGVHVPCDLAPMLTALRAACGGAMAIVSGRSISVLDAFLPGLGGPMVGGHGAEWWLYARPVLHPHTGGPAVTRLQSAARALAGEYPALLIEDKPAGVVVHFRADPSLDRVAQAAAEGWCATETGFEVHPAKMAFEIRPDDVGKDAAVARLMADPPFAGRTPVFFGDDTTDEVAIAAVEQMGGLGVKVGEGVTAASVRLAAPRDVRDLIGLLISE